MSIKILNKQNATIDEMARAFAEIETMEADLEGQKQAAYSEMVSAQQQAMAGKKGAAAKLDQAKSAHQDIELQAEACRNALSQIRERITAALPGHFRQRISDLEKQHKEVSRQRDKLVKDWLEVCAQAAVLHEQIRGRDVIHLGSGEMREGTPEPRFSYASLGQDNQIYYLEKVRESRSKVDPGESVNTEIGRIGNEIDKLERIIGRGDFAAEAESIIDSYRPEKPAVEAPEDPETKAAASTPRVVDYDAYAANY